MAGSHIAASPFHVPESRFNTMNEATFRRRLLIYYAVFGVFVAGWTVYTLVLRKHAIDLNQTIDGKLSR